MRAKQQPWRGWLWLALIFTMMVSQLAGCGELEQLNTSLRDTGLLPSQGQWQSGSHPTLYGKSTREVFKDPQTVALVEAACHGDIPKIDALVKQGANVNATGYRDMSVLSWTMACRSHRGAERLLELGANPNFKMKGVADISPMWLAAYVSDPRWLPMMLAHGGDPNIKAAGGFELALSAAIEQDRMQNVKLLLEHGADVNERYDGSRTAAMDAALLAKFDVVEMLLKHGYDYNLQDLTNAVYVGRVPPNDPMHAFRLQVLQLLAAKGFHPNVVPHIGGPPPGLASSSTDSGGGHP
jgi:ankyrin repeat protein